MSRNCKDKYESPPPRMHTLMSAEDVAAGKKSSWPELEITGTVCNISPKLWDMQHLTSLYLNDNSLYQIPADICRLTSLIHLDLSSNKLRRLPGELGELVYLRDLLLNNNYLRILPYELGKLFNLQTLGLSGNPLQPEIVNLYNEPNGTHKLLSFLLDNLSVSGGHPPQRPWVQLTTPDRSKPTCVFSVMCYNVLCDKYATNQMYNYCPTWALKWDYRKKGIMHEIISYSSDIICLQEVETDQFYHFFLPELKKLGYDGIFSPKSRAKTMGECERKFVDGCAIFFRTSKFTLIHEHLIEFNQLAMANAEGSDDMLNRVMTKDNIGLTALFQTKEGAWEGGVPSDPHQPLLVCTAHIHWDPEYCDVKLIQTIMLMNELRTVVDDAVRRLRPGTNNRSTDCSQLPLLLCGDLNSLPESGVIDYLSNGHVTATHTDFKDLKYRSCLQKLSSTISPNIFTHGFKLGRAYTDKDMPYTNYTFDFKGIIDYVFYSKQHMEPTGLLGSLDYEWFASNKVAGCPHPRIPSDHFPLLVEFQMPSLQNNPSTNGVVHRR